MENPKDRASEFLLKKFRFLGFRDIQGPEEDQENRTWWIRAFDPTRNERILAILTESCQLLNSNQLVKFAAPDSKKKHNVDEDEEEEEQDDDDYDNDEIEDDLDGEEDDLSDGGEDEKQQKKRKMITKKAKIKMKKKPATRTKKRSKAPNRKVRKDDMLFYLKWCQQEQIQHFILVSDFLTSQAKVILRNVKSMFVIWYPYEQTGILHFHLHMFQPSHFQLVPPQNAPRSPEKMIAISKQDPIVKWFGFRPGEIICVKEDVLNFYSIGWE